MFNSIANNFGAPVIAFKQVREQNYLVLNANFTVNPQNEAYKAAKVLEITVPTLNLERSTVTPVAIQRKVEKVFYGNAYNYDMGTFAKSWIKDAKTICIEKLPVFDEFPEINIFIHSLYCQLGLEQAQKQGTYKKLSTVPSTSDIRFDYTETFVVEFDKWVFLHLMVDYLSYSVDDKDVSVVFDNLPKDITADVPLMSALYSDHRILGGCMDTHIENGSWQSRAKDRNLGFSNTGNDVFSYAFLIKGEGD